MFQPANSRRRATIAQADWRPTRRSRERAIPDGVRVSGATWRGRGGRRCRASGIGSGRRLADQGDKVGVGAAGVEVAVGAGEVECVDHQALGEIGGQGSQDAGALRLVGDLTGDVQSLAQEVAADRANGIRGKLGEGGSLVERGAIIEGSGYCVSNYGLTERFGQMAGEAGEKYGAAMAGRQGEGGDEGLGSGVVALGCWQAQGEGGEGFGTGRAACLGRLGILAPDWKSGGRGA